MSAQGTMGAPSKVTTTMGDGFRISFSFGDFPELVHRLRREVARRLEERAQATAHPEVARELREVAADIETGLDLPEGWEEDLDGEG